MYDGVLQAAVVIQLSFVLFILQLLWVLDHLAFITSQVPETPNERNFQAQYGDTIASAIQRLRSPVDYSSPQAVWEPFKEVCRCTACP